ncbi:MAG TPA: hypothetical protein VM243_11950 [Phycisphaerae bacterium]|nr:hypothetical protein [Phycisphaerae bacterium]
MTREMDNLSEERRRRKLLRELGVESQTLGDELSPEEWDALLDEEAEPNAELELAGGEVVTGFAARLFQKILAELARRKIETPQLYEPLPMQLAFHQSQAPERIDWGSNRSGKTQASLMELVWAALGVHPYYDGYPKGNGRYVVVGKDGRHIAEVLWRKLTYPGSYKIIRDLETDEYRTATPEELETRKGDLVPGPPLLPPRMVNWDGISWENKKAGIPQKVPLYNGTEILFYSGNAAPPNGLDADAVLFDEEIANQQWYPECSMRLLDREGRFWWSATPQLGGDQLADLHTRAEELHGTENPAVEEFHMLLADNPYLSDEQKAIAGAKLSDEDYRVRILGEFAHSAHLVYPEYSRRHHTCEPFVLPKNASLHLFLDPGPWQVVAALCVALLPGDDHIYLFDEIYLKQCDAATAAEAIRAKTSGRSWQAFWIDIHAGRQTQVHGRTIEDQYMLELHARGVRSVETGSGFLPGVDDVGGGITRVHEFLRVRTGDGTSRFRVFRDRLPNLEWEFGRYRYKRIQGVLTDKPADRFNHLMDDLRYCAMAELEWTPPPVQHHGRRNPVVLALQKKQQRKRELALLSGAGRWTFGRNG